MAYNKTVWINGTAPPINAENLNKIEQGIEDAHAVVPAVAGTTGQVLTKTASGTEWSDAGNPTDEQVAEAVTDWLDENITEIPATAPIVDSSLTVQGAAADAKKTGDEIADLKSQIAPLKAIPHDVKIAIDTVIRNVAFKNDGDYSSQKALIHAWAEELTPVSISAEYTQGTTAIYPFYELDYLRNNLTVLVTYSDASVAEVEAYTLTGTLTSGTSTITASYEGLSSLFEVLVTSGKEFSYSPTDGSFVDLPYAGWAKSASSGITTTWSLANGTCFSLPKEEAKWSKANLSYFNYTNSAHLTMEFKFTQLAYYGTTNTGSPGEFAINIRDVTKAHGSTVGFARDGSTTASIKIRTSSVSDSTIEKGATVSLNTWHTLDIVIAEGTQTVLLDETAILTNANLSTGFNNYFAQGTCIGVSSHASSTSTIYIRSIEYSAD